MKLTAITLTLLFFMGISSMTASEYDFENDKDKKKNKKGKSTPVNKNFHSIKKWKIKIAFKNGDVISKTIEIAEKKGMSILETAFLEAEHYVNTLEGIQYYEVLPLSDNNYVLLATP